jgi:two-component sensor histidine kinase
MTVGKLTQGRAAGYAVGTACFLVALAVRQLSNGWLQVHYPYVSFFGAVIATAYFAGLGPALTVTAASAVTAYVTYAPPTFGPGDQPTAVLAGTAFLIVGCLCTLAIANLRAARDRLEVERKRYADLAENRDLLFRELQHRVSNNIQVVAGLLRVQAAAAGPTGRRALDDAAARVSLIARIQRELHNQAGAPTSFRDFAESLLADVLAAAGADHVSVRIDGGKQPLTPSQATAVSLVLLECVNNAVEHGFADGRVGTITVDLDQGARHWRLTVRDDGAGPPANFDVAQSKSLGLKIVRAMAQQLNGEFFIAPGQTGAICQLTFPVAEQA